MEAKELIRNKRKERGLTTTELADMVGVSNSTISRWERGEIATMKSRHISRLANALGISPVELVRSEKVVKDIQYKRTTDIGIRTADLIEELMNRTENFKLDGIILDKEDINIIISSLESSLDICRKIIKARHNI